MTNQLITALLICTWSLMAIFLILICLVFKRLLEVEEQFSSLLWYFNKDIAGIKSEIYALQLTGTGKTIKDDHNGDNIPKNAKKCTNQKKHRR